MEREQLAEKGAAFMSIISQSPDLLKGVDPSRISDFQKASGQALDKYRQYVQSDKISWTVIAAPSEAWAAKVFPELPARRASACTLGRYFQIGTCRPRQTQYKNGWITTSAYMKKSTI